MRLEEINENGKFQFITKEENTSFFWGTLHIEDGGKGRINLTLDDVTSLPYTFYDDFSLVGELTESGNCIFTDCFINSQPLFGNGEIKIVFSYALLKLDDDVYKTQVEILKNKLDIKLNGIRFGLDNLDLWVSSNNLFNVERDDKCKVISINCNMRDDITLYDNGSVVISVVFAYNYPGFPIIKSSTISETPYIEINKKNGECFDKSELWEYLHKFMSLMSVLLGEETCVGTMKAIFINDYGNRSLSTFIFQSDLLSKEQVSLNWYDINIDLESLIKINKEAKLIENWIDRFEVIAPSIELYRTYKAINNNYAEINFLWMAQAVEALHRRTRSRNKLSIGDYEKMCEILNKNCPEEYKEWLAPRLKYGNELSFKSRLDEFMEEAVNVIKYQSDYSSNTGLISLNKKISKLINDIVRYRNYYTHYDISIKKTNRERAFKLITLTSLLEVVLLIQILGYIGLNKNTLDSLFSQHQNKISRLLRKTLFLLKQYYS